MGKFNVLFMILLMCFTLFNKAYSNERTYGNFDKVIFVDNYDGDTFTIDIPDIHPIVGSKISVRVYGIDTPEIKGKCEKESTKAKEAKAYVFHILTNSNNISINNIRRDKYFRLLADVVVDGEDLATKLLDKDLAVSYDGGTKIKNWCE